MTRPASSSSSPLASPVTKSVLFNSSSNFATKELHPRHFCLLPCSNHQGKQQQYHVLAYGGDDGIILLLPESSPSSSGYDAHAQESAAATQQGTAKTTEEEKARVVRRFDDAVRAMAVSKDGRRVAVGFDDGSTRIFCYNDFFIDDEQREEVNTTTAAAAAAAAHGETSRKAYYHPFIESCARGDGTTATADDHDDDEGDTGLDSSLLTQSDGIDDDNELFKNHDTDIGDNPTTTSSSSSSSSTFFAGPRFTTPVRHMEFDPRCCYSSSSNKNIQNYDSCPCYYLAIASEGGMCIVNATSTRSLQDTGKLLEDIASREHDSGGVRGISYSSPPPSSSATEPANVYLASLGMDGRLVIFNVTDSSTPELEWDVLHRDWGKCAVKSDIGELCGSDPCDRSMLPVWSSATASMDVPFSYLALPGRVDVQLRHVEDVGRELFLMSSSGGGGLDGNEEGHTDEIVCMGWSSGTFGNNDDGGNSDGKKMYLVTGGRDGRVVLWEVEQKKGKAASSPGLYVCNITGSPFKSIPTHILWYQRFNTERNDSEDVLRIICSDGTLFTIVGRDNIVPDRTGGTKRNSSILSEKNDTARKLATHAPAVEIDNESHSNESDDDATVSYEHMNFDNHDDIAGESEGLLETQPPPTEAVTHVDEPTNKEGDNVRKQGPKRLVRKEGADDVDSDDDTVVFDDVDSDENKKHDAAKFVEDEAEEDKDNGDFAEGDTTTATLETKRHDEASKDAEDREIMTEFDDAGPTDAAHNADPESRGDDVDFDNREDEDFQSDNYVGSNIRSFLPKPQPAFAPSSTPLDLHHRIMCWNHVGTITAHNDGPGNNIQIQFVDSAFRRPMRFVDTTKFILGSLGEDGAIFASDLNEDDDEIDDDEDDDLMAGLNMSERTKAVVRRSQRRKKHGNIMRPAGSNVFFYRYETFGALRDKDWYITLPDGETAMGCASGEGWAAVITDRRFLRLFTSGGNQGPVIWLKGDPVTIAGRSRFLAVFYHESSPLPDRTQKLGYCLIDAGGGGGSVISSGSLDAISPGSSLSWAGFSNDCSLMVMDTDGMLSMLTRMSSSAERGPRVNVEVFSHGGWIWSPMLDTVGLRKSVNDTFWPITVQDGKLVCVPLKGGNEHPDAVRRPVTTTLGLRMPLARSALEKCTTMEELSVRANIALSQKKFFDDIIAMEDDDAEELETEYNLLCAQVDKVTLKLFMATVEEGKMERALDLVDRLHLEKSFDIAITVSDRLNHRKLSDRIEIIKERRFVDDGEDAGIFDDDPYPTQKTEYDQESEGPNDDDYSVSRRISPERSPGVQTSRAKRSHGDDLSGSDTKPLRHVRQRHADGHKEVDAKEDTRGSRLSLTTKRMNPFAKKRIESPARPTKPKGKESIATPPKSPSKLVLSRASTFSAQSREQRKTARRIL